MTLEDEARALLAEMGLEDEAQGMTAGDLVALANMLGEVKELRASVATLEHERGAPGRFRSEWRNRPLTKEGRERAYNWARSCVAGECPFADTKDHELADTIVRYEEALRALEAPASTTTNPPEVDDGNEG